MILPDDATPKPNGIFGKDRPGGTGSGSGAGLFSGGEGWARRQMLAANTLCPDCKIDVY
jgi:hypothetical protein